MQELALPAGVHGGGVVSVARDDPLGGEEPVDANGAASVDAAGGDSHLGPEAHPVAVRHPAISGKAHKSWAKCVQGFSFALRLGSG